MRPSVFKLSCAVACTALFGVSAWAGDGDWTRVPAKTYEVRSLRVEGVAAMIYVDVKDSGPVTYDMNGTPAMIAGTRVRVSGQELLVQGGHGNKVWDWRNWFNFRGGHDDAKQLYIHAVVPKGMPLKLDNIYGGVFVGSTGGPIDLGTVGDTEAKIGAVGDADISLAGGGKATVESANRLHAEIAGSGKIRSGDACDVHAEIAGSGSVSVSKAKCRLHVEIAGSGDFTTGMVNGSTHIEIAGSGAVTINDGVADPLKVEIMGSGDVNFGGLAVNPHVESMGSGSVRLKAYRGNLYTEGNANLKIGK